MKFLVCVVGKSGAGKETVSNIFKEELGDKCSISSHRFSDPLNEILDMLCLPRERGNQQKLSTILRQSFGEDILSRAVAGRALKDSSEVIFLDGVRRATDMSTFGDLPNKFTVFVDASPEIRFERLKKRGDRPGDKEKSWEQFLGEQNAEAENQIESVARVADIVFDNSKDLDSLQDQISAFIKDKLRLK